MVYYQRKQNRNKYNAKSVWYKGNLYQSKAEVEYAMYLDSELALGNIKSWDRQKRIELRVNSQLIANYYIDFVVEHLDGITEYVEIKGLALPVWRIKWKLFEALYGDKENCKLSVVYTGGKYNIFNRK